MRATGDLKVQAMFLVEELEKLSRSVDEFFWPDTEFGQAQERMILLAMVMLVEQAKILTNISSSTDLSETEKRTLQRDFYEAANATIELAETLDWLREVVPDFRRNDRVIRSLLPVTQTTKGRTMESVREKIRSTLQDGGSSLSGHENRIVQELDPRQKDEAARAGVAALAAAETAELEQT